VRDLLRAIGCGKEGLIYAGQGTPQRRRVTEVANRQLDVAKLRDCRVAFPNEGPHRRPPRPQLSNQVRSYVAGRAGHRYLVHG
jgi:hypothetical protein